MAITKKQFKNLPQNQIPLLFNENLLGAERNENMVKVGILTYHRSLNYGAVMQAYCLAEEIQKRFPDVSVEIVDYMSKR